MHPAWHIDDVRHLTFKCLGPQGLARLAQTCRALFNVTTDELWKTIDSFSPLLCCLPKDSKQKPLQAEDVERLYFYGSKVRKVALESRNMSKIIRLPPQFRIKNKKTAPNVSKPWEEVWRDVAKLKPASHFLPNLRCLRISNVTEELLIPLVGISGSNLTELYIKYIHERQPDSVVRRFLEQLQGTPRLECLFVRDGEADLLPLRLIAQSPLKHLRLDPRVHAQKHENFQYKQLPLRDQIVRKSLLEHLTLGLTREWYTPQIEVGTDKYLPALKNLWLNLTAFYPDRCGRSCINATAHSWTCIRETHESDHHSNDKTDCGRRPPNVFLKGLDSPELNLLNIKFPLTTTGTMFLDVVSAANSSCRLQNLIELALAGGGWMEDCNECQRIPDPEIKPVDLRAAMRMLLPLPKLKLLRLSAAPNFLDILDLELYKSLTDGLPALEKLWLGHPQWLTSSLFHGTTFLERVPLHHLAAFCSMLPSLTEVEVGTLDGSTLEEKPRAD